MSCYYDLKPCPFCGGEATLCKENTCFGHGEYHDKHFVKCNSCGATGKSELVYYLTSTDCQELAVHHWNTRTRNDKEREK